MFTKDRFIILQSGPLGTTLTGALCRLGLKSRDVPFLHRVTCAERTPEAVAAGLASLLDALKQAGLRPAEVRLCLSAETALFRDWAFPFRSRAKVEQALNLLLETEFPFDPAELVHRVCLTGNAAPSTGGNVGAQAISVSLRRADLDFWLEALAAADLFPGLVTVEPFPLLGGLPPRQSGLFLHIRREYSTLALLENGILRRIRVIPMPEDAVFPAPEGPLQENALRALAAHLKREADLALEGTAFVPERLYAYGEVLLSGGSAALAEAFGLPVSVPGQEQPLAGQMARLGENDPDRLLALCVAAMPNPARWRQVPSFHRPPPAGRFSGAAGRLAWAGCGAFCVGAACLASLWAEGYADQQRALRHEDATRALFRKALPESRGSFNPVQMESILKTRIAGLRGTDETASFPVLRLLQAMHAAVPPALDVRLDRLSLDPQRCGLSGTAASYDQVNALRTALSELPGVSAANILSAANRTGKADPAKDLSTGAVLFEIELVLEGGRP